MPFDNKFLNKQQTELRRMLLAFDQHEKAIDLFLRHHAMLHSSKAVQSEEWSYADEILDDMTNEQIRCLPPNNEHSVAWIIWHIARIEDVTMNLLVAGDSQILSQDDWLQRMNIPYQHTGNGMEPGDVACLSETIDVTALRAYRAAVCRKTREIVPQLSPKDLQAKIDPTRLQQVMEEEAVLEAGRGVVEYWGRRNIAGLLLMPPTRHCLIHLNEAIRLKKQVQK